MKVVLTYDLSRAPKWVFDCVREGDLSGILEYTADRHPDEYEVKGP